jgi:hypothetical protein
MTGPQPYGHVRAGEEASIPPDTYRAVGTGEPIALLRVGDEAGRRVTTGDVVRVDRDEYARFEAAGNPDRGISLGDFLPPLRT